MNLSEISDSKENLQKPPQAKPPPSQSEFHPLTPYLHFVSTKYRVIQSKIDCKKLADDIFGIGKTKPLDMNTFFKRYFMKTASGVSEQEVEMGIKENEESVKETFQMLVGKGKNKITKNLFLNKLKNDGICPTVQIMPIKSRYQMQDETQTCGIQNKNNILTILVIVLILLSIFYLLNKKKK